MITSAQTENLAKLYQIDNFTIMREYLQLLFLSHLYQNKQAGQIYFKGGTAIRLLFDSPRFSEDLDFSTLYDKNHIKQIISEVEKSICNELPQLKIFLLYSGKNGLRFRFKYQPPDFKYPLVIRLDFTGIKKTEKIMVSPLVTKFPILIFPLIVHLAVEEIFAEKISALMTREKGRDFFDVWFLLEKGVLVPKNIKISGLLKKIKSCSQTKIERDLTPFLPRSQRKIAGMLKKLLIDKLLKNA